MKNWKLIKIKKLCIHHNRLFSYLFSSFYSAFVHLFDLSCRSFRWIIWDALLTSWLFFERFGQLAYCHRRTASHSAAESPGFIFPYASQWLPSSARQNCLSPHPLRLFCSRRSNERSVFWTFCAALSLGSPWRHGQPPKASYGSQQTTLAAKSPYGLDCVGSEH